MLPEHTTRILTTVSDGEQLTAELIRISDVAQMVPLTAVYRAAFAGPPWFERTKCAAPADLEGRCPGGRSPLWPGEHPCETCGRTPTEPAFTDASLATWWESLISSEQPYVYVERSDQRGLLLAALAYCSSPGSIGARSYAANEAMRDWMVDFLPSRLVYLEEIFADLGARSTGNLWNLEQMTRAFCQVMDCNQLLLRTINDHLKRKYASVFPGTTLFAGRYIPDHRDVLLIDIGHIS